ncbi:MAG TPA: flagellar biosynthesis anti-sigma factor FlgM [Haliangiales bacterium]|nr:flagellar biosynthesis anti-sigma factor FlgM [Haliangiales bacterium]
MRIDGTKIEKIDDSRKDANAGVSRVKSSDDAVVVSARAKKLHAHASETAEAREKRVAQIGAALDGGTYKVDHQKLAERLVDEDLARWGR